MFLLSLLLGGGGLIGGIAMLILRPALRKIVGDTARKVPAKVWIGIAIAAALGALVWWHFHTVSNAYDNGKLAGQIARDNYWKAEITKAEEKAKAAQDQSDREALAADIDHARQLEKAHAVNEQSAASAVAAYAAAHPASGACRVLGAETIVSGPASGPAAAAVRGDTGQPVGPEPAPAPEMVAIPRTDLDWFAWEAMQNAERGQYLDGRLRTGRAVKASDLPRPNLSAGQ